MWSLSQGIYREKKKTKKQNPTTNEKEDMEKKFYI